MAANVDRDQGFTLIELLFVMIVIGILMAIAIPVFLNQRMKSVDSAMRSDLKTVANAQESYYLDHSGYLASGDAAADLSIDLSTGNTAAVTLAPGGRADVFCVRVSRVAGMSPGSQAAHVYISDRGGIQPAGVTACS